jgi:hypothetical protein
MSRRSLSRRETSSAHASQPAKSNIVGGAALPTSVAHDTDEGGDGDAEGLKGQRATTPGCWPGGGSARRARRLHREFTSVLEDIDSTPFMKGLPDDRCQCPHWGYVFKGKLTARYADRDEVFEVGDAFYTPPGHVPVKNEPGTEILWFSPSEELRTAEAVMMKNMQALQDGSTP